MGDRRGVRTSVRMDTESVEASFDAFVRARSRSGERRTS